MYRKSQLKVRDFTLSVKAADVKDDGSFSGYGSVFGVEDSYGEVVAPGAFKDSLAELAAKGRKVPILWQHRTAEPIGIYDLLEEDDVGLKVDGTLAVDFDNLAKRAHGHMKMGSVTGLSIGYWVRESSFDEKTGIRTLRKLDLVEVSLVTFPANDEARVEAVKFKLAHGQLPNLPEFERILREAGFSKSQAAVVANRGLPHLLQSESESAAKDSEATKGLSDILAGFSLPQL
ncbi:HK97 family phage prohead protease [Altericroceibacterium spongiae]|uniref:HK97 family phage prohead protease n=1 Tax=Altericroceibacterium spongiae TaxID=2320269 RepID=A0A420ERR5_9SPHN|nr:HK97 family phage prohead protease [Altericroceibacterium spongiae]RKF23369.1 HK97 family phage prohead protease [Altericroceibacterium spongiae]